MAVGPVVSQLNQLKVTSGFGPPQNESAEILFALCTSLEKNDAAIWLSWVFDICRADCVIDLVDAKKLVARATDTIAAMTKQTSNSTNVTPASSFLIGPRPPLPAIARRDGRCSSCSPSG